jgi:hypothetical protein
MAHNVNNLPLYDSGRNLPSASEAYEQTGRKSKRLYPKVCQSAIKSCLASISRAVKSGMTSTVADIPTFAFGEPLSDVDDVTDHVKTILELRGYSVTTYQGSHAIAISWAPTRATKPGKESSKSPRAIGPGDTSYAPVETAEVDGQFDVGL